MTRQENLRISWRHLLRRGKHWKSSTKNKSRRHSVFARSMTDLRNLSASLVAECVSVLTVRCSEATRVMTSVKKAKSNSSLPNIPNSLNKWSRKWIQQRSNSQSPSSTGSTQTNTERRKRVSRCRSSVISRLGGRHCAQSRWKFLTSCIQIISLNLKNILHKPSKKIKVYSGMCLHLSMTRRKC